MYNRYIPQGDGSFRRSRYPEPPGPAVKNERTAQEPEPVYDSPREQQEQPQMRPNYRPGPSRPARRPEPLAVGNFLKQLLPKDFDTEDLLIVLLLLLMSADCREDQNSALLTLVLYLFG